MRTTLRVFIFTLFLILAFAFVPVARAANPSVVVVNWGDTLYKIAVRTGTSVNAIMRANGLPNPNFVYAGQKLVIPNGAPAPAPLPPTNRTGTSVYIVTPGDMLYWIAARYGTTADAIMRANGMRNPDYIYPGQRLNIPARIDKPVVIPPTPISSAPASLRPSTPVSPPTDGKWIDVDIGDQTITAYQGSTPLKTVLVSTGVAWHPTPVGRYKVYMKIQSQTMSGGSGAEYYSLPGVPWVMYFTGSFAVHGTYWHHNFGKPMSHGCVNLTIEDAKWFFDWAEMGTPVITHY